MTCEEEREEEYRNDPVIQLKQVMAEDEEPLGPFCPSLCFSVFDVSLLNLNAFLRGVTRGNSQTGSNESLKQIFWAAVCRGRVSMLALA